MFDGLLMFGTAVVGYLTPVSLGLAFGATLLGLLAGCMPGLSATLIITLLTTLTLKMQPNQAILVLVCAYNGAIYGGSRTAILLNIPGTAANAAACIDGHALAKQGQAGRAMGASRRAGRGLRQGGNGSSSRHYAISRRLDRPPRRCGSAAHLCARPGACGPYGGRCDSWRYARSEACT